MVRVIPTKYNGIQFRSKLEAQWAKFFDALGIKWVYEPEGYEFEDGVKYLPDFYLPQQDAFFEVKGIMSDFDQKKVENLARSGLSKQVVVGYSNGRIELYENTDNLYKTLCCKESKYDSGVEFYDSGETRLIKCPCCHRYFFFFWWGTCFCRRCGNIILTYRDKDNFNLLNFIRLSQIDVRKDEKQIEFVECMKSGMGFVEGGLYPIIDYNNGLTIMNGAGKTVMCHTYIGEGHLVIEDTNGNNVYPPSSEIVWFE